jgi:hypothetical protein
MDLPKVTAADVDLIPPRQSPDPTLNRQYFSVSIGQNVGRCYVENSPEVSSETWPDVIAQAINLGIKTQGRQFLAELCSMAGVALNVAPGQRQDTVLTIHFRDPYQQVPALAERVAEKARARLRLTSEITGQFLFAGVDEEKARQDLEFALKVVLGAQWGVASLRYP